MSIGRGDGITLHKITNVPTLIAKKTRHMDPDSLEMQDPDSVSGSEFNESGSTTLLGGGIL
jgi:hypothetical protein